MYRLNIKNTKKGALSYAADLMAFNYWDGSECNRIFFFVAS
jgi:hypothetical protein